MEKVVTQSFSVEEKKSFFESFSIFSEKLFLSLRSVSRQYFFALLFSVFFLFVSKLGLAKWENNDEWLWEEWISYYSNDPNSSELFVLLESWYDDVELWDLELWLSAEELAFLEDMDDLVQKYKKNYIFLDWILLYQMFLDDDDMQEDFDMFIDVHGIDWPETLKTTYIYLNLKKFFIDNDFSPLYGYSYSGQKETLDDALDKTFDESMLLFDDVYGSSLSDIDDVSEFVLAYEYLQQIDALPQKVLVTKHPGIIAMALMDDALFEKENIPGSLNGESLRGKAIYLAFKQHKEMKTILNLFDVRDFDHFMRLFFPVPLDQENLFLDHMTQNFDWSQMDDISTAFSGDFAGNSSRAYTELGKDLFLYNTRYEAERWFSVEEQKRAFNKVLQINNIKDIGQVDLDVRQKALMEVMYRERVFDQLNIPDEERLPLSIVALRNDMTNDDAKVVSGYKNLVYVPTISFLYRAMLEAYVSKKLWGENAPDVYAYLATTAHETNMKNIGGDVEYGTSKGPPQFNGITVWWYHTGSYFSGYTKSLWPPRDDSNSKDYAFAAPENTRAKGYFFISKSKWFNPNNRVYSFQKYTGIITDKMRETMNPSILAKKEIYGELVNARYNNYVSFVEFEQAMIENYRDTYQTLADMVGKGQDLPGYDPAYAVGYLTFLQNLLSWREKFTVDLADANDVFYQYTKDIFNPDEQQSQDISYKYRSLAKEFQSQQNIYSYVWEIPLVITIDPRSYHYQVDLSGIEVSGNLYIKYSFGDPALENTLYQYLRGNLEEGIEYHNNLWQEGDPYYQLVKVNNTTRVKVYQYPVDHPEHDPDGRIWDKEYLANHSFLKLYRNPNLKLSLYTFSGYGTGGIDVFVEDDDGNGQSLCQSSPNQPDLTEVAIPNPSLDISTEDSNELMFVGASLVQGLGYANRMVNKIAEDNKHLEVADFSCADVSDVHIRGIRGESIKYGYKRIKKNIDVIAASGVKYIFLSYISNDARAGIVWDDYAKWAENIVEICNDYGIEVVFFEPFCTDEMDINLQTDITLNAMALDDLHEHRRDFYILSYDDILEDWALLDPDSFVDEVHFHHTLYPQMLNNLLAKIVVEK